MLEVKMTDILFTPACESECEKALLIGSTKRQSQSVKSQEALISQDNRSNILIVRPCLNGIKNSEIFKRIKHNKRYDGRTVTALLIVDTIIANDLNFITIKYILFG